MLEVIVGNGPPVKPGRRTGSAPASAAPRMHQTNDGVVGVYGISVAADLAGMSVQALRLYERRGLLEPGRTAGGTRRYSDRDVERLRRIGTLIDEGLNLAGIARVLGLEAVNADLQGDNDDLRSRNAELRDTARRRRARPRSS
jgi:MerR family transcriptional regulator, heat shock protein HspR